MNIIAWDLSSDTAVSPERAPSELEWSYNKTTKVKKQYNTPKEPEADKPIRLITKRSFMRRFDMSERIAIRKSTDDIVIDIYEDLKIASNVNLDLQDTIDALNYLDSQGLLTVSTVEGLLRDGTQEENSS